MSPSSAVLKASGASIISPWVTPESTLVALFGPMVQQKAMMSPTSNLSAAVGEQLLHYRILSKLGQGGMGEVYMAADLRLNRRVALKLLPPSVSEDPVRRQRFAREAKAVAALNHPNIVTLHAVEEDARRFFIVMELVEGQTLAQQIRSNGLPWERFFEWAIALADAVGSAHQRGITHRDLKPQNVMIGENGRLKVLDFGLAKIEDTGAGDEDVRNISTATLSVEGGLIGTLQYMSPEQAQGKQVDHRTDIFSLGLILFEMVTGGRPFNGDSRVALLASIIRDPSPNIQELRPDVPPMLRRIIERCLAKDPNRRYQSLMDLRADLEDVRDTPASARIPWLPSRKRWVAALTLLVGVAVAGSAGLLLHRAARSAPQAVPASTPPRLTVEKFTQLTADTGPELSPSLAPDGNWFVYATRRSGNWDLYRLRIGGEIPMNLTADTKEDDTQPAVSPDGERIAFRSERMGGGIFIMGATGESARRVADFGYAPSWSPDGTELVVTTERLMTDDNPRYRGHFGSEVWAIRVDTGQKRKLTEGDALHAVVSPHGQRIVYWGAHSNAARDLWTAPFKGSGPAVLLTSDAAIDWNPVWSSTGDAVYFASDRGGMMNLWRIPVDEQTGKPLGPPEAMTNGVLGWSYAPSISRDGRRMLFVAGGPRSWVGRMPFDARKEAVTGEEVRIAEGEQPRDAGNLVAFQLLSPSENLAVISPDGTGRRKLTDDVFRDRMPRVSPDGQRIAFASDRGGALDLWLIGMDGTVFKQLTQMAPIAAPVWSPDGKRMSGCHFTKGTFLLDPSRAWNEQTPEALPPLPGPGQVFCALDWSPDGRMLVGFAIGPEGPSAGTWTWSFETREYQRYDTQAGAASHRWLSDSRRVLYIQDSTAMLLDTVSKRLNPVLSINPDRLTDIFVTQDNRWIYFSRYSLEGDIWMATLNE